MKKVAAIFFALLLMVFALSSAMADGVSGTFEGTAKGFGGDITVQLTLTDGVITAMTAEGASETPGVGSVAIDELPAQIVAANSVNVDVMTSASFSSAGIIEAAKAALEAAGVNVEDYMDKAEAAQAEDAVYDTDIVIVGAGGAGMTAAITAADAGKKVIIVESQPIVGGNSVKSTGGMNAAKTEYQDANTFGENAGVEKVFTSAEAYPDNDAIQELAAKVKEQWEAYQANPEGYFDSVELMELDTLIGGKGLNDPALVDVLCSNTKDAIDWLTTVDIQLFNVAAFGGASVKRIHRPVDENGKVLSVGAYIVPRLEAACAARENITILKETTANKILTDDSGAAVGIEAAGKTGEKVTVNAKAVILASGGFGANLEMVASYKPELAGFMTTNAPGILGQGIKMAEEVGAATVDMDQIQIHPTMQADTAALITEGLRGDGAILVNAEGKRFIDEVGTRDVVSAAEIAQPGSFSWLIVDQKMTDASTVIQGYITKGFTFQGDTYEALAAEIGVDPAAFAATMNDWNEKVAAKSDPDFGRTSFANPLDTAPFYAIKVTAGIHHTMGGVKIDTDTHVLKADGTVIPGLFAAGEVTGGVHGANRLGGTAVADIVVFGRIAGAQAAEFVK